MARNLRNQNNLIYVVDADTKQLIRDTLLYDFDYFGDKFIPYYSAIYGGTITYENLTNSVLVFDEKQITELGYDYSSITGNVIEPSYDPELDAYLCPSVVIIYMSKLK